MLIRKLVETCESKTDTVEHFLQGLDQSQWLKHVKAVLEASVFISEVNITKTQTEPLEVRESDVALL